MVVVGADVHKRTHTFVAVDEVGQQAGRADRRCDHGRAPQGVGVGPRIVRRGAGLGDRGLPASVGPAGTGPADRGAAGGAGAAKDDGAGRASARTRGKSDPIDALAVARAFLREPDLPVASHDEVSRELKLLVDRREVLGGHQDSTINSLLWRVHELDPEHAPKPRSLDLAKHQQALAVLAACLDGIVAELARTNSTT